MTDSICEESASPMAINPTQLSLCALATELSTPPPAPIDDIIALTTQDPSTPNLTIPSPATERSAANLSAKSRQILKAAGRSTGKGVAIPKTTPVPIPSCRKYLQSKKGKEVASGFPQVSKKRTASAAGLETHVPVLGAECGNAEATTDTPEQSTYPPTKITKRRAARACVSCRLRKVRCDVVEGAPCGNCRWDGIPCVVQESRRRKKNLSVASVVSVADSVASSIAQTPVKSKPRPRATSKTSPKTPQTTPSTIGVARSLAGDGDHVPHLIYQRSVQEHGSPAKSFISPSLVAKNSLKPTVGRLMTNALGDLATRPQLLSPSSSSSVTNAFLDRDTSQSAQSREYVQANTPAAEISTLASPPQISSLQPPLLLPAFITPLPSRIGPDEIAYLKVKGALTLPSAPLQSALLRAYVEYVQPYLPVMNVYDFLLAISASDGSKGRVSLLLYQVAMFAATAFVDQNTLRQEGFSTKREARKAMFLKVKLLYDFDYEQDRLVLMQALLLMTYWYDTPNDTKETWHWMGTAIMLAQTIGLHRDPSTIDVPVHLHKQWRRIWWSCFMRDRLIGLGMPRPIRIRFGDYDAPMLTEDDFEYRTLPDDNLVVPLDCRVVREIDLQKKLASLCVEKVKLCVCMGRMKQARGSAATVFRGGDDTVFRGIERSAAGCPIETVETVDAELTKWREALPEVCRYQTLRSDDMSTGYKTLGLHRNLLHMLYCTTVSGLHKPRFLRPSPTAVLSISPEAQELSRLKVREAADDVSVMAEELLSYRLEQMLPTTGVSVVLPSLMTHLLEMRTSADDMRQRAVQGFQHCMRVMIGLCESYAAADFAMDVIRKAAMSVNRNNVSSTLIWTLCTTRSSMSPASPPSQMDGQQLGKSPAPGLGHDYQQQQQQQQKQQLQPQQNQEEFEPEQQTQQDMTELSISLLDEPLILVNDDAMDLDDLDDDFIMGAQVALLADVPPDNGGQSAMAANSNELGLSLSSNASGWSDEFYDKGGDDTWANVAAAAADCDVDEWFEFPLEATADVDDDDDVGGVTGTTLAAAKGEQEEFMEGDQATELESLMMSVEEEDGRASLEEEGDHHHSVKMEVGE